MINWILNLIGIFAYFLNRFNNRKNKTKLNFNFWLNDNWPELFQTLLINVGLMLLLSMKGAGAVVDKFLETGLPWNITIDPTLGKAIIAFALGLGLTSLIYSVFKAKVKQ